MTEPACSVEVERTPVAALVSITGEFDLSAFESVYAAVEPLLAETVELYLAGVTFMDSSGLRCLLQLEEAAARRHGRVVVTEPSPTVRRLFELTGLVDRIRTD